MRDWFILFATTFTITVLALTVTTEMIEKTTDFNAMYVQHAVISSALLSLFMRLMRKMSIQNRLLVIALDITMIFVVVFVVGYLTFSQANTSFLALLSLVLILIIYTIITLIYKFILKVETVKMNKKIKTWRDKHVES